MVNTIISRRSAFVWPRAWKRASLAECSVSGAATSGLLKDTCSHSASVTPCVRWFLSAFPASQSKPVHRARLSKILALMYMSEIYNCQLEGRALR